MCYITSPLHGPKYVVSSRTRPWFAGVLKEIGLSNCGTLTPVSHNPHVFGVIVLGCFRFVCQTHKFLLSFVLADFPIFTPCMVLSPWLLCVSKQCHLLSLLWKMNPVEKRLFGNKLKEPTTHGSRSGVVGGRTLFPSGIFKYQRGGTSQLSSKWAIQASGMVEVGSGMYGQI